MSTTDKESKRFLRSISEKLANIKINDIGRGAGASLRTDFMNSFSDNSRVDRIYSDDDLAPVMPAIDAVQQIIEEENKLKRNQDSSSALIQPSCSYSNASTSASNLQKSKNNNNQEIRTHISQRIPSDSIRKLGRISKDSGRVDYGSKQHNDSKIEDSLDQSTDSQIEHKFQSLSSLVSSQPSPASNKSYEFIPKSVTLDVYSNDPEVKRFLTQLLKIANEYGYNEQDYKCFTCRRPIGMIFGESRLCYFDGHHYCNDCHLGEKAILPARVLCNWDFDVYPISKRNQHFLKLIANEPMFEIKTVAPLLYEMCPELDCVRELRSQAFFIRSYCFTCVQESIFFELNKLVWPREHLIKQIDLYSLEDLIQIKNGQLQTILKTAIRFGTSHVLSCVLCRQKGFICEICKSSQIIYPFETESVHRCNCCQSIFHKNCFKSLEAVNSCPRCQRLRARQDNVSARSS